MKIISRELLLIGSAATVLFLYSATTLCAEEAAAVSQASEAALSDEKQTAEIPAPPAIQPPASNPAAAPDLTETAPEFRPEVVISQVGDELNIQVNYSHPMDFTGDNAIDYIRMETLSGEFLGLSSFNAQSQKATAEFMVNPKLANFDQIRLVAKSRKVGLIKSIHKLEVTKLPEPPKTVTAPTPEQAPVPQQAPSQKKKRWGIF